MKKSDKSARKITDAAQHPSFHKRFQIHITIETEINKFINRVTNHIWDGFLTHDIDNETRRGHVLWQIANDLGEEYDWDASFYRYTRKDFYRSLHALESAYKALLTKKQKTTLSNYINYVLGCSEIDLGISWNNGIFVRTGARLLDKDLVNDPLEWMHKNEYKNVYKPFEKGLTAFLEAENKPSRRYDVIRDMYESLEAMAKVVTGKPRRDLSANSDMFIKFTDASVEYKRILKEYITYANTFRHGLDNKSERKEIPFNEVESFIYLTGLFIRLAMK